MENNNNEEVINKDRWLDDTHYDAIILGTGLVESLLAGAISRIGKQVLHLDKNEFYGSYYSSFNLKSFEELLAHQTQNPNPVIPESSKEFLKVANNEHLVLLNCESAAVPEIELPEPTPQQIEVASSPEPTPSESDENSLKTTETPQPTPTKPILSPLEKLLSESRHYNIDLTPRFLFSNGDEVGLLVTSGVAQYLEYKNVDGIYLFIDNALQLVPCSKSDVFKSKYITLLEKRALNKFLGVIKNEIEGQTADEDDDEAEKTPAPAISKEGNFVDFLTSQGLNAKLRAFVMYAIALIESDQSSEGANRISTESALESLRKFVISIGKYGNSPLLAQLYGMSELPQAFCRLCAVYGGMYILRRSARKILLGENGGYKGIVDTEGQELTSNLLISSVEYLPQFLEPKSTSNMLSRCVVVSSKSLVDGEKQVLAVIPPQLLGNQHAIHVLQQSNDLGVSPKGKYLVHLTTVTSGTAKQDLSAAVSALFHFPAQEKPNHETKPNAMYYAYFNALVREPVAEFDREGVKVPQNVILCGDPKFALDCGDAVAKARRIFQEYFPGEEFLPKLPNPDHIVWEDDKTVESTQEPPQQNTSTTQETKQEEQVEAKEEKKEMEQ